MPAQETVWQAYTGVIQYCSGKRHYDRAPETERKAKPDFLFPGITEYRNEQYPAITLTMPGAKTTCKGRWRQVLQEAGRIAAKHILILESAIGANQTNEMQNLSVQLVLPKKIRTSYRAEQQKWPMNGLAGTGDWQTEFHHP